MKDFITVNLIIEKFIQSEMDNYSSDEYIKALNECETLEDLIEEVKMWKKTTILDEYSGASNYILLNLDK